MRKRTISSYCAYLLLTSMFFLLYAINYSLLREYNVHLYLGSFFDYHPNPYRLLWFYIISAPLVAVILQKSASNLFLMLLSTLVLLGGVPGIIIYSQSSNESIFYFYSFYILLIFLFGLFSRKNIRIRGKNTSSGIFRINEKVLFIFSIAGFVCYVYLSLKYYYLLSLRSINDVYIQRSLFASVVTPMEGYLIIFSKFIGSFSFLILAIKKRRALLLLPIAYIYIIDYLLSAQKSSAFLFLFCLFYYFYGSRINFKKYIFYIIFLVILAFSLALHISWYLGLHNLGLSMISLYDRVFDVSAGLFARNFEFANTNYFFHGGIGLLGKLFGGAQENPYIVIGEYYFSKGVVANADMISDGYVNFGTIGSIMQIFALWLFIGKRDNRFFKNNHSIIIPLTVVYSMVLFSMGFQTALLTGGMLFFFLLLKLGFTEISDGYSETEKTDLKALSILVTETDSSSERTP